MVSSIQTSAAPQARVFALHPYFQVALTAGIAVFIFVAGYSLGANRTQPVPIQVSFPDRIQLQQAPVESEKVSCLEWVSRNFTKPTAGVLSLVCNGRIN